MTEYSILPLSVTGKEAFLEASREELRVLLVLIERGGRIKDADELSVLAKTSVARAAAALIYWSEAGIISEGERVQTITEEFEERIEAGQIREVEATEVAKTIRRASLAEMLSEVAALMQREALNNREIKELVALYEQYGLTEEYIVTLAAYLSGRGSERRLTVTNLKNEAIRLTGLEVDNVKALEEYIVERESDSEAEREFRKIFGAYGRALSKSEKECFKKWSKDYGYFTDVVGEAYDIAVTSGSRRLLSYADKLLTAWFLAGCKTLSECKKKYADDEEAKKAEREAKTGTKKTKKEPERYGDFDANEAFLKALERSYGTDK